MAISFKRSCAQWGKGLELFYNSFKNSEKQTNSNSIIFLHGLFGSLKNNRGISRLLLRDLGRPIFTLDLRNHGESPQDSKHDYLSMADDLGRFMSTHSIENPTLIGHSMGAKVAMVFALKYPSLIKDIISVDNAPARTESDSNLEKCIEGMKFVQNKKLKRLDEAERAMEDFVPSLQVRQFLCGNLFRSTDSYLEFKFPLETLQRSLNDLRDFPLHDPELHMFDKPSLFIRGTKSRYITQELIPDIKKFFPKYKLVDVEAGHWVISENPEAFRRAVVKFLDPKN